MTNNNSHSAHDADLANEAPAAPATANTEAHRTHSAPPKPTGDSAKPHKGQAAKQAMVTRARSRRYAMQAVYQHLLTGESFAHIAQQVSQRESLHDYDRFFFSDIIEGIEAFGARFDEQLTPFLNRPMAQLGLIEHAILLVACYELNSGGTPPKVAINEAVILAKKFGGDDSSHKFVNAVLDGLYQSRKHLR